mgnify:FL=1
MMKVKLKCFSQVKYALGENEITYELKEGTFTHDLEKMVREKANGKLDGVTLSIAVNKKYISKSMELKDGDEIALIPPVQGG